MNHAIWTVLEHQGRTLTWLAQRTGYSENLVISVKVGRRRATPGFRAKCAAALDIPEHVLFSLAAEKPAETSAA